jgi:hypothetical protein
MDTLPISINALDHLLSAMTHILIESIYNNNDLTQLFEIQRLPDHMKAAMITQFNYIFNTFTENELIDVSYEIMNRLVECMDTALYVTFKIYNDKQLSKDDVYEVLVLALEDLIDIRGSGAVLMKCYLSLDNAV